MEESRKDQFLGAVRLDDAILEGTNALGRLLMELREVYSSSDEFKVVTPPNIENFKLYGEAIANISIIKDKDFFKEKAVDRLF